MPELGAFGSARGVPGNGHSYRKPRPKMDGRKGIIQPLLTPSSARVAEISQGLTFRNSL